MPDLPAGCLRARLPERAARPAADVPLGAGAPRQGGGRLPVDPRRQAAPQGPARQVGASSQRSTTGAPAKCGIGHPRDVCVRSVPTGASHGSHGGPMRYLQADAEVYIRLVPLKPLAAWRGGAGRVRAQCGMGSLWRSGSIRRGVPGAACPGLRAVERLRPRLRLPVPWPVPAPRPGPGPRNSRYAAYAANSGRQATAGKGRAGEGAGNEHDTPRKKEKGASVLAGRALARNRRGVAVRRQEGTPPVIQDAAGD